MGIVPQGLDSVVKPGSGERVVPTTRESRLTDTRRGNCAVPRQSGLSRVFLIARAGFTRLRQGFKPIAEVIETGLLGCLDQDGVNIRLHSDAISPFAGEWAAR